LNYKTLLYSRQEFRITTRRWLLGQEVSQMPRQPYFMKCVNQSCKEYVKLVFSKLQFRLIYQLIINISSWTGSDKIGLTCR